MDKKHYYKTLKEALKQGAVERRTIVSGPNVGDEALFRDGSIVGTMTKRQQTWDVQEDVLVEHLSSEVELVIFGGGHIALELYHVALRLGLELTIIDERKEYCNPERFPGARCICAPFEEVLREEHDWIRPYFIIATRGHGYDQLCLEHTLRLNHSYIGMIGSKRKVAQTRSELKKKGFSDQELNHVFAPIGLAIKAVTASEIAVSILAQIISEYRKNESVTHLEKRCFKRMLEEENYIVVRVVAKTGSAPCSIGFQLAYFPDDTFEGTVGGGVLEALALEHARKMLSDGSISDHVQSYNLDAEKAGSIGMICGGNTTLLFQRR